MRNLTQDNITQAVIALNDSKIAGARSIADLKGAKLGAAVGTTSYRTITDVVQPSAQPAVFDSNDVAKAALSNGQILHWVGEAVEPPDDAAAVP